MHHTAPETAHDFEKSSPAMLAETTQHQHQTPLSRTIISIDDRAKNQEKSFSSFAMPCLFRLFLNTGSWEMFSSYRSLMLMLMQYAVRTNGLDLKGKGIVAMASSSFCNLCVRCALCFVVCCVSIGRRELLFTCSVVSCQIVVTNCRHFCLQCAIIIALSRNTPDRSSCCGSSVCRGKKKNRRPPPEKRKSWLWGCLVRC